MDKQTGTAVVNGQTCHAEKWSDGTVCVLIGSHWYRVMGAPAETFKAR